MNASYLRWSRSQQRIHTQLCRSFTDTGLCSYGKRCRFVHSSSTPMQALPRSSDLQLEKTSSRRLSIFQQLCGAGEKPPRQPWIAHQPKFSSSLHRKRATYQIVWSILYIFLQYVRLIGLLPQKAPPSVWFQSIWSCFRLTSVHFVNPNTGIWGWNPDTKSLGTSSITWVYCRLVGSKTWYRV